MSNAMPFDAGVPALPRSVLTLAFESGEASLDVRRFVIEERLSQLFTLTITAVSLNPDLDLAGLVGGGATFAASTGVAHALVGGRAWSGICRAMDLVRVEPTGVSTYEITIVPRLWQLTQRRNHRIFQHVSLPDIVDGLLGEWSIEPLWRIARDSYPKLEIRVQYGESDYDFLSRLLEEAGITFSFADVEGVFRLILEDQPHSGVLRAAALPFRDSPGQAQAARQEYVTAVRLHEEVRPGRHVVRDFDYRRPKFRLEGSSTAAGGVHALMEQYFYRPGASLAEVGKAGGTPTADDKGMARHADEVGQAFADRSLKALRGPRRVLRFETGAIDLAPGAIFSIVDHPRRELGPDRGLLVTRIEIEGVESEPWRMRGEAVFVSEPYQPPQVTTKPQIHGLQSALVVGPDGQEIYTDEFGRVRVQFHWDREGDNNDDSSVWMRVVYNASGPGYGIVSIPRVGHEVIIAFMEGDPDLPMVVGSTYNATSPVPYELPDNKTVSTWKAASSPGGEGFNEIKMENKAGQELLYQQAEKDLAVLVKNDEVHLVGHDRSVMVEHDEVKSVKNDRTHVVQHDERTAIQNDRVEQVGHDEHVGIGNDRAHQIKKNDTLGVGENHVIQVGKSGVLAVGENRSVHVGKDEQISIGQDQSVSVGQSRSTSVGINDSLQVGSRYTVTVSNGLKGKLATALGSVLDGGVLSSLTQVIGPFATGPLQQVVTKLAKTSIGATPLSKLIQGPAAALQGLLPGPLQGMASMVSGQVDSLLGGLFGVSAGPPTTFDMVDKKITITTGDASIVLDGGKIILQAKEGIFLTSAEIGVQGAVKVDIVAGMHPMALAVARAQAAADNKPPPPPEELQGALLLSGMKELAAISPEGQALLGAKEGLRVGCDAKIEVVGTKEVKVASSEGDAIVLGKTVQLNPPAKTKEEEEHEAKPNEEAEAPHAVEGAEADEYQFKDTGTEDTIEGEEANDDIVGGIVDDKLLGPRLAETTKKLYNTVMKKHLTGILASGGTTLTDAEKRMVMDALAGGTFGKNPQDEPPRTSSAAIDQYGQPDEIARRIAASGRQYELADLYDLSLTLNGDHLFKSYVGVYNYLRNSTNAARNKDSTSDYGSTVKQLVSIREPYDPNASDVLGPLYHVAGEAVVVTGATGLTNVPAAGLLVGTGGGVLERFVPGTSWDFKKLQINEWAALNFNSLNESLNVARTNASGRRILDKLR